MKHKKGLIAGIIVLVIVILAFVGYNMYRHPAMFRSLSDNSGDETSSETSAEPTGEPETTEMTTEAESSGTDANGGNILVAYFSYTGNTEEAAQLIAEYTGGDLAEIERAEEYGNLQEEAEGEILDGVHPEITVSVDNIAEYDTIFVGYAGGIIGLN